MKKVLLSLVLLMGMTSAVQADAWSVAATQLGTIALPIGVFVVAANMNSDSPDLNKVVTVNRDGDGYNSEITLYEFNRSKGFSIVK